LSRKALDALLALPETHRFLRGMVNWLGYATATVPFMPASRGAGTSKYTLRRMLGLAADGLLSFSKAPLRLSLLAGGAACLLGPLVGAAALLSALIGAPLLPGGVAVVLVVLLVLGGAILCSLGVVGEYVGRTYEEVKGRPLYLLKEALPPTAAPAGRRHAA
jgi:dolichol-phosphate mannosyltransferase